MMRISSHYVCEAAHDRSVESSVVIDVIVSYRGINHHRTSNVVCRRGPDCRNSICKLHQELGARPSLLPLTRSFSGRVLTTFEHI